jgi:hypothetical protein
MNYEEYKKQEEIKSQIKKKEKKLKKKLYKKQRFDKIKESILNPPIHKNLLVWEMEGTNFYGYYENICFFHIKRGVMTFSLKINNKELKEKYLKTNSLNIINSMDLLKVQKKANDILTRFITVT